MGMIWRSTMVLLSTLAALVIIVHSAEEDYEAQYNMREMRPRMLDTGIPRSFEQPWRTIEVETAMQQSTQDDTWLINSSEEPPRRRRLGRKRKRRPEPTSIEDLEPPEQFGSEDQARPYFDVDSTSEHKISNTPKRRRKKLEPRPQRWESPAEEDRPIRRRGHRRKRPSQPETWPEFSEFNVHRPNEPPRDTNDEVTTGPLHTLDVEEYIHFDDKDKIQTVITELDDFKHRLAEDTGLKYNKTQKGNEFKFTNDNNKHENITQLQTDIKDDDSRKKMTEDTSESVSEISNEDTSSVLALFTENEKTNVNNKIQEKQRLFMQMNKARKEGPIDPMTLKEILKRSNGTSLSEILQQHNMSLADLLHGKEEVLSVLKLEDSIDLSEHNKPIAEIFKEEEKLSVSDTTYEPSENPTTTENNQNIDVDMTTEVEVESTTTEKTKVENASRSPNIRKFSTAMRRKQRIRPMMNTTYKSQLSRDMIALNARKYFNNRRRNSTQEWKDHIPMMKKNVSNEDTKKNSKIETTTAKFSVEITTQQDDENCTKGTDTETDSNNASETFDEIDVFTSERNKTDTDKGVDILQPTLNVTERPIVQATTKQAINASGLRRHAFNNRLKKKRLKQKNLTTEPPQDDIMMNLFGIPNLVSSSEFIAQTQVPKSRLDDITILEDFMTTSVPHIRKNKTKTIKYTSPRTSTTPQFVYIPPPTEKTAKIEIEEIFNDTQTSARLSKILKERNMTLNELVEHRERGSSHVHLADIFHNASKEPNPPEPFLSKSLIEPISKETYPLRALLDANNHDTTAKATTIEPVTMVMQTELNIPVVMDFGKNVNENAENMGIMSLFHNITKNEPDVDKTSLKKDSQGTLYETSITVVNTTDGRNENDTMRESRVLHVTKDNQDDVVSWNEIFSLMRRNYENQTEDLIKSATNGLLPAENIKKPVLEDLDGDGVIVLEDLQRIQDFDSKFASESNENLDFNAYERAETPTTKTSSILDKVPNQTKAVTVATASIAGLAMVLFLLTYVGYRWKQQRNMARKKSFSEEHVPTPVFENRKGHKNNSSSRSISPMLSSNIYTINTLDSINGKESPDYMWDSLRKPFQ